MSKAHPRRLLANEWPRAITELPAPPRPSVLYLSGRLPEQPGVAIVGTRLASAEGREFATTLAHECARAGFSVLSGGAEGIDAAAHHGALSGKGYTLVVAPAGFERPFPAGHQGLFRQIVASDGGYLSICAPDEPAHQPRFFARNACLVAMSDVVVVVEAGFRSGARNAAKYARRLGRKLFVVPAAPWVPQGRGCLAELKAGAQPLASPKELLAFLESLTLPDADQLRLPLKSSELSSRRPSGLSPRLRARSDAPGEKNVIVEAVRAGAATADEIAQATGLGAAEVQRALLMLRLQGVIAQDATGELYPIDS